MPDIAPALTIEAYTADLISDFISCIIRALHQKDAVEQWERITGSLRRLAVEEYDWQTIAGQIVGIYNEAINQRKGE